MTHSARCARYLLKQGFRAGLVGSKLVDVPVYSIPKIRN
jgi:hypothetical protein